MKIQITNIEPQYIDTSTLDGFSMMVNYYLVHFMIRDIGDEDEVSGIMKFVGIKPPEQIENEIKQRLTNIFNAKD